MNSKIEKIAYASTFVIAFGWPVFILLLVLAAALFGSDSPVMKGMVIIFALYFITALLSPLIYSIFGVWIERIHFRALEREERELSDMTVSDLKTLPTNWKVTKTFFVCENVVVSNDYLKRLFWTFRKIVGGRSNGFTRLVERARREATIRMMRRAREFGANVVWNVRFETTIVYTNSSGGGDGRNGAGVEVFAYGTAFRVE